MQLLPTIANSAWTAASALSAARFRRALKSPVQTQQTLLTHYLQKNANTEFGRTHHFSSLRTIEDYQHAVPPTDHDALQPHIEKIAAGQPNILTHDPVRYFALTSGSAGPEKWIPYTASLLAEFRRAIAPWIVNLFTTFPQLRHGPAYWSITPLGMRSNANSRIPIGFDDDTAYLGRFAKPLVDAALAVPNAVRHLSDMDQFRYVTLLHLLRARDLRLISVWHPSFLILLLESLPQYWDRLISNIGEPHRAREIERVGPGNWPALWPALSVISCWSDAAARAPAQQLATTFPGVTLQPKGLLSTEAFASLPFYENRKLHHPLAIRSHFFELLEDTGRPIPAHDAEPGGAYTLVLTTGGGLYRYQSHDRVRITGRLHATPCIEFLGKTDLVSDRFGEKLNALFVADTLAKLPLKHKPHFIMLAPDGPGYTLFIEPAGPLPVGLSRALDKLLSRNPHYDYCRRLGQLPSARVFVTDSNAKAVYLEKCGQDGQRLGDIKPTPLHHADRWCDTFRGCYFEESSVGDRRTSSTSPATPLG